MQAGIPDLIGCVDGKFFAFEVKVPGKEGKATKLQMLMIEKIKEAGGHATIISDPEDAVAFVARRL